MGRLPCLGAYLDCLAQTGCQKWARKPTSFTPTPRARIPRGEARWPNQTSTYTRAISEKCAKPELRSRCPLSSLVCRPQREYRLITVASAAIFWSFRRGAPTDFPSVSINFIERLLNPSPLKGMILAIVEADRYKDSPTRVSLKPDGNLHLLTVYATGGDMKSRSIG
jgi:hypothetical protein